MNRNRRRRPEVALGIDGETAHAGDHIAYFYETDREFEHAFGFLDTGLRGNDHCVVFGIEADTDRALDAVRNLGWDPQALLKDGRLSVVRPLPKCDDTVAAVSAHFQSVYDAGAPFIRFIGNAAVGHDGWPSEEEFYKLEATVSHATLSLSCIAICMFDLRAQPARTIMKAAFEGHPLTLHRNCIRENPLYVPRAHAFAT